MLIQHSLAEIEQDIRNALHHYHRQPGSVQLLPVSKGQSIEKMLAVYEAGARQFGENYLQEALLKIEALKDKKIEWHFIGPLQSNKTRKIAEQFAWVHSVDSLKIAKRLHEQRPAHLPPLQICIQVNVSGEINKSGIAPAEATGLARECQALSRLTLRGLMTIPLHTNDFISQRAAYRTLFLRYQHLREEGFLLDTLSMGMSEDMEAAIAEGSTLVRIGRKLFGDRH